MAKTFNFNNVQKQYFTTTLPDEKQTTIMICTPTKELMGEILSLGSIITPENMTDEKLDSIYTVCSKIMSHNKGGIKIPKEFIAKSIPLDHLITFIGEYATFIKEASNLKN